MIDEMKRQKRELVYKGSILDIYKDTMQLSLIHIYTARKIMKNKKIKCDIYTRVSTTMQVAVSYTHLDVYKRQWK